MNPHFARLLALIIFLAPSLSCAEEGEEAAPPTEVAVDTAKIIRTTLHRHITAYGTVEPEPASAEHPAALARLSPAVAGIITEAKGIEGQHVNKGEVLFRLDSRAAEAALAKAQMAVDFASKNAKRQQLLLSHEGTSEKRLLEAEQALAAAQTELAAAKVTLSLLHGEAPLSGTLTKFSARPGEAADATTVLAEIIDFDRLVATVRIPHALAGEVKPGQKAKLRATDASVPVEATVTFVSPQIDPATDTVAARISLPRDCRLRPGQFLAATLVVLEKPHCLAVPREAVYTDPDGHSTLSLVTDGTAKQIGVTVGLHDGDLIEVEGDGLREGATVVTLGSYALPEETKIIPAGK